jgi:hypothetical protein
MVWTNKKHRRKDKSSYLERESSPETNKTVTFHEDVAFSTSFHGCCPIIELGVKQAIPY